MLRRYLFALGGAAAGALVALLVGLRFRGVALFALGGGALAIALGERTKFVPTSEEANKPVRLFSDEDKRKP